jgi:hypothetical protein
MSNIEDIKFQIDQIRKDKIIYAAESAAASVTMLTVILLQISVNPLRLNDTLNRMICTLAGLFALGYWAYCSLGNLKRFHQIQKLEKSL